MALRAWLPVGHTTRPAAVEGLAGGSCPEYLSSRKSCCLPICQRPSRHAGGQSAASNRRAVLRASSSSESTPDNGDTDEINAESVFDGESRSPDHLGSGAPGSSGLADETAQAAEVAEDVASAASSPSRSSSLLRSATSQFVEPSQSIESQQTVTEGVSNAAANEPGGTSSLQVTNETPELLLDAPASLEVAPAEATETATVPPVHLTEAVHAAAAAAEAAPAASSPPEEALAAAPSNIPLSGAPGPASPQSSGSAPALPVEGEQRAGERSSGQLAAPPAHSPLPASPAAAPEAPPPVVAPLPVAAAVQEASPATASELQPAPQAPLEAALEESSAATASDLQPAPSPWAAALAAAGARLPSLPPALAEAAARPQPLLPPQSAVYRPLERQAAVERAASSAGRALAALWRGTAAHVKWPAAVFAPFFCLVTLLFGAAVSADLLPLWVLGPLLLSLSLLLLQAAKTAAAAALPPSRQLALLSAATSAVAYARSGRLPGDAQRLLVAGRRAAEQRGQLVLARAAERRASLAEYVSSGRMARDAAAVLAGWLRRRQAEAGEWLLLLWEDVSDWLVVNRRRLAKVLEKVF